MGTESRRRKQRRLERHGGQVQRFRALGLSLTPDGSISDLTGKLLYISINRFFDTIVQGDCCFMCGASNDEAEFNGEHVIPKWILKKYNLFAQSIILPNGTTLKYDKYLTPCCKACNSYLGGTLEESVSTLIEAGPTAVAKHVRDNGPWLIFVWLNLLFLKTHLKDRNLRIFRDLRGPANQFKELYPWEKIHHVHCIARSKYVASQLDPTTMGSLFVLPARTAPGDEFDYGDLYDAQTMMLRLGETAFITVLNDSCAVVNVLNHQLRKLTAPLSSLQLRELMARAAWTNLCIKNRPVFHSDFTDGRQIIAARTPTRVELREGTASEFGELHYAASRGILEIIDRPDIEEVKGHVKKGVFSFLFDASGNFTPHPHSKTND